MFQKNLEVSRTSRNLPVPDFRFSSELGIPEISRTSSNLKFPEVSQTFRRIQKQPVPIYNRNPQIHPKFLKYFNIVPEDLKSRKFKKSPNTRGIEDSEDFKNLGFQWTYDVSKA